ncbi:acyltransferase family protein [uncultured Rothia sp.]|uniref:acyltransferase family protein n=1 Tax=uncultured Rothia sp. TaxID=316088 RepID=UPI0025E7B8B4|nr:acyltransferase family protein [uncultured Rothia sp.]
MLTRRDSTIDIAKGIAIIAIVFGHIHRGMWASGLGTEAFRPYKYVLDYGVYFWHLVVFAFLSGLFVSRGALKTTPSSYLTKRLILFGYLYVIWQVLQVGMKLVLPSNSSDKTTVMSLLELWKPEGQLWFFPWLMIVTIIAVVTRVWRKNAIAALTIAGSAILALASWGYIGEYVGTQGLSLLFFFLVGVALGHERFQRIMSSIPLAAHAGIVAVGLFDYIYLLMHIQATPPTVIPYFTNDAGAVAMGILATVISSLTVLSLSYLLARVPWSGWLAYLGRHSLEIFIAHIVCGAAFRFVLTKSGLFSVPLFLVGGTIFAILASLLLGYCARKLRIPLFTLPRPIEQKIS